MTDPTREEDDGVSHGIPFFHNVYLLERNMSFKDRAEKSPVIFLAGVAIAAFVAGIGTVSFLEAREDRLREEIIESLQSENAELEQSTAELEVLVADLVERAFQERARRLEAEELNRPLGGENSEARKNVEEVLREIEGINDSGEVANIVRDPTSDVRRVLDSLF